MTVGKDKKALKYNPTVDQMYAPKLVLLMCTPLCDRDRKLHSSQIRWPPEKPT